MTNSNRQWLDVAESAKAYVAGLCALIGVVATTLLSIYVDNATLTVIAALATAVGTFVSTFNIPNSEG